MSRWDEQRCFTEEFPETWYEASNFLGNAWSYLCSFGHETFEARVLLTEKRNHVVREAKNPLRDA